MVFDRAAPSLHPAVPPAVEAIPRFEPSSPRKKELRVATHFPLTTSADDGDSADSPPNSAEKNHRQLVLHRAQSQRFLLQEEVERDHEAREAYREERRWVVHGGWKLAATEERVHMWLTLLCFAGMGRALRHRQRRREAARVLGALWVPVWRRWHAQRRAERRRQQLAPALAARLPPPTVALLDDQPFFRHWPLDAKQRLVASLRPTQCEAGVAMLLEGDPGTEMYFIVAGRADVVVRRKGLNKSRNRSNGTVVATLTAGAHFGEFALVNDEPRMASVWCVEQTVCWALRREAFVAEFLLFPPNDALRVEMDACIRERRVEVMAKLFPLTPRQLMAQQLFAGLPSDVVSPLVTLVQPHVVEAGQPVFLEGMPSNSIYFLACGRVQLWKKTAWWRTIVEGAPESEAAGTVDGRMWDRELGELISSLRRGDVFGEVGVVTLEPQPYTAQAATIADLWLLSRPHFKDFMLSCPTHYLRIKELINLKRAAWIDPLPPDVLKGCTALRQALKRWSEKVARAVQDALVPQVAGPGDVLACDGLLFVTKGTLLRQDTGEEVCAGTVAGHPRLADDALPTAPLKALGHIEGWLLPMDRLNQLRLKSLAVSDAPVPVLMPQPSPTSPLHKRLPIGTLQRCQSALASRAGPPSPAHRPDPANSAPVTPMHHDASHPPTPTSSQRGLRRVASFKKSETPNGLSRPSPFCRQRTCDALKFAAGYMPPGFAARPSSSKTSSRSSSPARSDSFRCSSPSNRSTASSFADVPSPGNTPTHCNARSLLKCRSAHNLLQRSGSSAMLLSRPASPTGRHR